MVGRYHPLRCAQDVRRPAWGLDTWNMIRTAVGLLVFVVIVAVLGLATLVIGLVYPSRRVIAFTTLFWARAMLWVCGVRLTVVCPAPEATLQGSHAEQGESLDSVEQRESLHYAEQREYLDSVEHSSKLFVGNHQSALDIPILIVALKGRVRFMAKNTLFRIPVFGWTMWRYGYVPIHRTQPRRTRERLQRLFRDLGRKPMSFVLFPEGTRSSDGRLLPFRKGAMKICQRAGLAVVPFCIDGAVAVCPRNQLRLHPGPVRLTFCRAIPVDDVTSMSSAELHDRVRTSIAEGLERIERPPRAAESTGETPPLVPLGRAQDGRGLHPGGRDISEGG